MKKMKFDFGEGGFQGFVVQHVEKCVLGVIIVLVGWLIVSGTAAQNVLDPTLTKENLLQAAESANTQILTSDWTRIAPTRAPASNVPEQVNKRELVINPSWYVIPDLEPQKVPQLTLRKDPILVAAENIRVVPLYGPLALKMDEPSATGDRTRTRETQMDDGPLGSLPVVIGSQGGSYGVPGGYGEGVPGVAPGVRPAVKPPAGKKKPRNDDPYGAESVPGPPAMENAVASNSSTRTVPPEATQGLRPRDSRVKLKAAYAMVITATVPFDKQWREYQHAFANSSGGQNPKRDVPQYLGVLAFRADVTDDPNADPAKLTWTRVRDLGKNFTEKSMKKLEEKYAAFAMEPSDPEALDSAILSPVPPFLLTDLKEALVHPQIPLAKDLIAEEPITAETQETTPANPDEPEFRSPMGSGAGNLPGSYGGGAEVSRPVGGVIPGYGGSEMRPGSRAAQRMMSADGRPAPVSYDGIDVNSYKPVANKLVRFVDYDVRPGRKYRYKLQLVLEDANHPGNVNLDPEITSLSETTQKRVKALDAEDAKKSTPNNKFRTYWQYTPDSPVSEVAAIGKLENFYGSDAEATPLVSLKEFKVPLGEPKAKVLVVQWIEKLAAFVPADRLVQRAAFLSGPHDVEIVHPVLGDVRKAANYPHNSKALVLDIAGGDQLPGTDNKNPIRAPGETLLMDRSGKLVVVDGVADVDAYRRFVFPEVKKEAAAPAAEMYDDLSAPGEFGLEGYPTPPARGKNR